MQITAARSIICMNPNYRSLSRLQPYSATVRCPTPIKGQISPTLCSLFGRTSLWSHLDLRHLSWTLVRSPVYLTLIHYVSLNHLLTRSPPGWLSCQMTLVTSHVSQVRLPYWQAMVGVRHLPWHASNRSTKQSKNHPLSHVEWSPPPPPPTNTN